jgi:uncharacterized protein YbjT (DUF2867 family)
MLVTGGTGALGSQVVRLAKEAGWDVRLMSRQPKPDAGKSDWTQADVVTGQGLEEAVRDIDVIIHCASKVGKDEIANERDGTANLLNAARQSTVTNVVYASIVGIDHSDYSYYRAKMAGEAAMMAGGVPFTIVRMTQFHSLIRIVLDTMTRSWGQLSPIGWQFQPLAPEDAAAILLDHAGQAPAGRVPDVGGAEIRTLDSLAESWMAITGKHKRLIHFPMFGQLSKAWRSGINLVPGTPAGTITWEQWLRQQTGH